MLVDDLRHDFAARTVPAIAPPTVARLGGFDCATEAALAMHHEEADVSGLQFVSLIPG